MISLFLSQLLQFYCVVVVVIAIIAILAAMLLPALSAAPTRSTGSSPGIFSVGRGGIF